MWRLRLLTGGFKTGTLLLQFTKILTNDDEKVRAVLVMMIMMMMIQ